MRILLATDGSSYSVAASESVARRPWPQGTEVKIISIAEITPLVVEPWYIDARLMQSVVDEQTRQAQEAVSSAERVINSAHLKSSTAMPVGAASGIILDEAEAWEADLVVVGSHGRHGLERLLIGSVSESVAIHAHCSVEVIRKKIVESASLPGRV
jgi:nucleotide-binding universal stress UspA family protein